MKINRAKNPNNLTIMEQMHLPLVIIPEFVKRGEKFKAIVKIGKVEHPMTDEHYIMHTELYIDGVIKENKYPESLKPVKAEFVILLEKDSIITVKEECNLHGIWESEKEVILYRGNGDNGNKKNINDNSLKK